MHPGWNLINRIISDSAITLIDTFTDTNGTLLNVHSPDTGPTNAWASVPDTWTISSNAAINAPTLGDEKLGNFTASHDYSDGIASGNWIKYSTPAAISTDLASVLTVVVDSNNDGINRVSLRPPIITGQFYRYGAVATLIDAAGGETIVWNNYYNATSHSRLIPADGNYVFYFLADKTDTVSVDLTGQGNVDGFSFTIANPTFKSLTTSELFAMTNTGFSTGYVKLTDTVIAAGSILGAAMCGDAANPSNAFVGIANRTAGNFQVYALDSGTWTSLINTAFTYAANAEIVLLLDENKKYLYAFYNNVLIGTRQDVSSYTGIVNNTWHGMFSTSSGNSVSGIDIKPLQLGSDLITVAADRTFSSDTGFWSKGANGSIGSGTYNLNGAQGLFYRNGLLTVGEIYHVQIDVVTWDSGAALRWRGENDASTYGELTKTAGTTSERYLIANATSFGVTTASFPAVGSLDNISVRQVQ